MKIIRNNIIPFKGYTAINLFGILFVRGNAKIDNVSLNHEAIHTAQMKELWYVFFYALYGVEWLIRFTAYCIVWAWSALNKGYKNEPYDVDHAYRNISFEREAYSNEKNMDYIESRKIFAWIKYIKKLTQST